MSLYTEIFEQAEVISNLMVNHWDTFCDIAKVIRSRKPNFIFLCARGSSDNAGRYAQYLWGMHNQLPIALAAPSLFSLYKKPPMLNNALVVGISQSGMSPDIISVIEESAKQNCLSLAIVNEKNSPLAKAASYYIDICAGAEFAVAATKTYTAELMSIALLSAALNDDDHAFETLHQVPAWISQMLSLGPKIQNIVERYRYMDQCVVLGRGFNYSTAFEWSLKMKELSYVVAEPYSSADFMHGPIAIIDQGYPVMAVIPEGKTADSMVGLLKTLKNERKAELLVITNREDAVALADSEIRIPVEVPEWLSPIISIIPAQLFAYYLTQLKGYDTEAPRSLLKITETH
jgi:glucosamine--fructose-6-phosphate aminotransferase (isomerizing)